MVLVPPIVTTILCAPVQEVRPGHLICFLRRSRHSSGDQECAPFRFHDLRHSHASHLLRAGVHPKIISERLGHSTVGITLDTYSHVLPGMQEEAVRLLGDALETALRKASPETRRW